MVTLKVTTLDGIYIIRNATMLGLNAAIGRVDNAAIGRVDNGELRVYRFAETDIVEEVA